MNLKSIFISNLKKYRKEKNLTQEKLAELSCINPKYLSAIETGKKEPRFTTIEDIANSLNISSFQLFEHPKKQDDYIENLINFLNSRSSEEIKMIYDISQRILKK